MKGFRAAVVVACFSGGATAMHGCGLDAEGSGPPDTTDAAVPTDAKLADAPADATVDAPIDTTPTTSCKATLARDPSRAGHSGVYAIAPDGRVATTPLNVHCDMAIDGGGWTLVGRSERVPTAKLPFGWRSATGSVTDLSKPYSLDVVTSKLVFTEIMIADHGPGSLAAATRAYKFPVAADFLPAHTGNLTQTTVTTLFGDCKPAGGPTMLKFAGATSYTDDFFLRDVNDTNQHRGLTAFGWDLAYQNCMQGASLDMQQGLLFVR